MVVVARFWASKPAMDKHIVLYYLNNHFDDSMEQNLEQFCAQNFLYDYNYLLEMEMALYQ